jgi:S1-C subfamily serine protease
LVTSAGNVIGVNTAVIRGGQGIAFAVPINTAEQVVSALLRDGRVRRAVLGVSAQTVRVPRRLVLAHLLPSDSGAVISEVHAGSPAEKAGIRAGDIVIDLAGTPITSVDALQRELTGDRIDVPVPVRVLRGGEPRRVIVVPTDPALTGS